jgi:hypothetical protein
MFQQIFGHALKEHYGLLLRIKRHSLKRCIGNCFAILCLYRTPDLRSILWPDKILPLEQKLPGSFLQELLCFELTFTFWEMCWLSWLRRLGAISCNAAIPGSILASPTV